jgi:hypothetical protein
MVIHDKVLATVSDIKKIGANYDFWFILFSKSLLTNPMSYVIMTLFPMGTIS